MKMSKIESAVRLALAFSEAFNRHDSAGIMQLMSDDCVFESNSPPPGGSVYTGRQEVSQFWQELFQTTSHAHLEIEDVFGFGSRCVMRWRCDWVNAAGEKRHNRGVDIIKEKGGLICELLSYMKGQA